MQLIKANYTIIPQNPGIQGIYEQAELPGRICYGSQHKIAPGTAEKFVKGLMQSNHGAPLEHNGVYLDCDNFKDAILKCLDYTADFIEVVKENKDNWVQFYI